MKDRLLQVLKKRPGEFISGEELSSLLKISRSAVWKHIRSLRQEGFSIEARTHRGYCLLSGPDRIIAGDLVPAGEFGNTIVLRPKVVSTNTTAKELALQGYPHGTLIIAEEQTGGKGRLGRSWFSPPGEGIWMSLILRPPLPAWEVPKITLLTAVALIEALNNYPGLQVSIKWPNDILREGRKIAGILTEMQAEMDAVAFVILGVGINVNTALEDFPEDLKEKAGSVTACLGNKTERAQIVNEFMKQFDRWYGIFLQEGFEPVRDSWKKWASTLGKQVTVQTARGILTGKAIELMPDGALLVRDARGQDHVVHSGDINEETGGSYENQC